MRIKRLRHKGRRGSLYALFDMCGVSRVSERAQRHSVQVAIGQWYERSRETLRESTGMEMSRTGIWKVVQERGKQEHQRVEEQRRRVFELGEIPRSEKGKKNSAVVEIDGTLIATREMTDIEEVRGETEDGSEGGGSL